MKSTRPYFFIDLGKKSQSHTLYVDRFGRASFLPPFNPLTVSPVGTNAYVEGSDLRGTSIDRVCRDVSHDLCSGNAQNVPVTPRLGAMTNAKSESQERKNTPVWAGAMRYFPDALCAVARLSKAGNDKHNPGQPLHWSRGKSNDHGDCLIRHQLTPETIDSETGESHAVAVAWRALAQAQILEEARLGEKALSVQVAAYKAALDRKDAEAKRELEEAEKWRSGWRTNSGNVRDIPGAFTYVDARLRNGTLIEGFRAYQARWRHTGRGGDIVAYRLRNDLNLAEAA